MVLSIWMMETLDPCYLLCCLFMISKNNSLYVWSLVIQAYQRLQIQQQMMQAQRNVSGPIRQQEQQVSQKACSTNVIMFVCNCVTD